MVNKKPPLEAEANNDFVEFSFRGVKLNIPTGDKVPRAAIRAFEHNQVITFIELMLGDDWFKVEPKVPTMGDVKELADALTEALGSNQGE